MNYRFHSEIRLIYNAKELKVEMTVLVCIQFSKDKKIYRQAVRKMLVNKKEDIKSLKAILRQWVVDKKKKLIKEKQCQKKKRI